MRLESLTTSLPLTLGEGNTPLLRSRSIGPALGLTNLFFKLESLNPTGSYKDRFASAAITDMAAQGKRHVLATSSGNTGAALAAYSAAADMKCTIAVVDGAPVGKLHQMMAYGADIQKVRGFGLDAEITQGTFDFLLQAGSRTETQLQISAYQYSPTGMQGVEAISHEIVQQLGVLGQHADHVFSCAGGGGLTLAVSRGFQTLMNQGIRLPCVHCIQPSGNNTIAGPLRNGKLRAQSVACTSKISGLQVASVIDGHEVIAACRASKGTGVLVEDEAIYQAHRELCQAEGIFSEPAGAVPLAGLKQAVAEGWVSSDETVICLVTGTGFKDPASVESMLAPVTCKTVTLEQFKANVNDIYDT
ncbi:pyridoxal-phosphate dependent enzyme [Bremerella alba]|uniref:Threonine synthase n=1 Tax=Bremerella alba TaxID=980252 RepID=A0A7V8V9Y5_9BACT|nr:pyridoxal-phosphate dependent enzyme [Bremerella alba]MBA2117657.1 Threonine synthase [Bremerella alba]